MKTLSTSQSAKTYFDPYAGSHVTAVHDVSLDVEQGEFVSVVGPSGCGKTTILNMVAGFIPYSGGEILLDGKPVSGPGPERGVVFQSFALFPWKTVLDNVGFGPKMRGVPKAERDKIAHEYLALAGLSHAANRYPNELSGGMQQRVGVVRALANNPAVLLMDEPFASVDAQTRMTLQEELTRIWQERRPTVIFITHDVAEAVFLANRVVVLSKGRVLDQVEVELPRPRVWDDLIEDDDIQAAVGAGAADGALRHEPRLRSSGLKQGALRPRRGRRVGWLPALADAGCARKDFARARRHFGEGQRADRPARSRPSGFTFWRSSNMEGSPARTTIR